MDRVLLSAGRKNIDACLSLARDHQLGIEVMAFAFPDVLDGDWRGEMAWYRNALRDVPVVTLHGPFFDLAPGSPDRRLNALVMERYRHAIEIASELGARVVILHANFIGSLRNEDYRTGWHTRNVEFWGALAPFARERGVTLGVENMWEYDPNIIIDVLKAVNHPNLRATLDVGHSQLFSDFSLDHWLEVVAPYLVHTHLNNNDGNLDIHRGLPHGVLNYHEIIPKLRAVHPGLTFTLEMDNVDCMKRSLPFFDLGGQKLPEAVDCQPPETVVHVLKDDAELGEWDDEPVEKDDTAEFPPVTVE